MTLPYGEAAFVPSLKLTRYLLSTSHPVGRSKARFLRSRGFHDGNVPDLRAALVGVAQSGEVTEVEHTPHGVKHVVEGEIQTPHCDRARIRTVWITETGDARPRFVTAYPA